MATDSISRPPALLVPRYVANLNALAERCGMTTSVRVGQHEPSRDYEFGRWVDVEGEHYLAAKWVGTRAQLANTGLLTQAQLLHCSPVGRNASRRVSTHELTGIMTTKGDRVGLELDFGEVPREITLVGRIEVIKYADEVAYHGAADELIAAKVCPAKHLPKHLPSRKRAKHGSQFPNARSPHRWAREQPDGYMVYCIETPDGVRRRLASSEAQSWDRTGIGDIEGAIARVDVSSILARFGAKPAQP